MKRSRLNKIQISIYSCILAGFLVIGLASLAPAATTCTFSTSGTTMALDADCTTDETIGVPDGIELNGRGNSITAVDPAGGHFKGPVVGNEGATAYVTNLMVNTDNLDNVCDSGSDRLRGIMFVEASGSIIGNTVSNINQGASGCQEGNAIEVRAAPFDNTATGTYIVEIAHNYVDSYQKGGIICNGDVDCSIHHNTLGASATQENLAANTVQLGFGARGVVEHNHIAGNQWLGPSNFAATAVLVFSASSAVVQKNNIGGNADVGIFIIGDGFLIDNNRVFESGKDGPNGDYGLVNFGTDNEFTNNKVRGYATPAEGDTDGTKVIPSPHDIDACFQTCD